MDILTHCVSGAAAGTVAASFTCGKLRRAGVIGLAALGGSLPDIDAASLWTRFDSTIGGFFGITMPGKEVYSAKLWYSHHGFFHSIAAGLFWCVLIFALLTALRTTVSRRNRVLRQGDAALLAGFFGAFFLHLLCDMPTPASTWGGVRLFWPSPVYIGGTGRIWWWNNYDIFLVAAGVFIANSLSLFLFRTQHSLRIAVVSVALAGTLLCLRQIPSRGFDFGYTGYARNYRQYEEKSKEIQRRMLGFRLFGIMERFDRALPFNF